MVAEQRPAIAGEPPQAHQRYVTIEEMDSTEVGQHLRQGVFIIPEVTAAATTTEDAVDGEAHTYLDGDALILEIYVASLGEWVTVGVVDPLTIGTINVTTLNVTGDLNHDGNNVGFFGVTPTTRPGATADIKDALTLLGLLQGTSATPLNLDGGALTAGAISGSSVNSSGAMGASGLMTANAGFQHLASTLLFWAGTGYASKPTVSGSRGGNAALASLLTTLATYGLITDGSSA